MDAAPNWEVELEFKSDAELERIVATQGKSTKAKWASIHLQRRQQASVVHQHLHIGEPPPSAVYRPGLSQWESDLYYTPKISFWRRLWKSVVGGTIPAVQITESKKEKNG